MSIVYSFAFASLYWQQPGLYSDNGILPLRLQIQRQNKTPFIVKLSRLFNWTPYRTMECVLLISILLGSLMIIFKCLRTSLTFATLWLSYYSCFQIAGQFLYFQWDTLLLEAGFLTILVAPMRVLYLKRKQTEDFIYQDRITLWLIRWLAFRLLFASGIVKLTGGDETWWSLTATTYHYQSQCIPTSLAYYAHHAPAWLHKLSTALVYMFMSGTGILFFSPFRKHRIVAFVIQTSLQLLIALTGNYNFFNILTVVLCLSLIDDQFLGYSQWESVDEQPKPKKSFSTIFTFCRRLIHLILFTTFIYLTIRWFDIHWNNEQEILSTRIIFNQAQLDRFLRRFLPICLFIAWCSLVFTIGRSVFIAICRPKKIYEKIFHSTVTISYGILAMSLFFVSMFQFAVIEKKTQNALPDVLKPWHDKFQDYHIFNAYGLFRSMTGVDGRPELIIEGAASIKNPKWKEYEFFYKPGSLSTVPPFVAPHQPRLDWQMWFAALSNYQHEPWLAFFLYRLLTNQAEVLRLIQTNPFPTIPPKQIRVLLYRYNFTKPPSKDYWKRELVNNEWFPTISLENQWFMSYIQQQNMVQITKPLPTSIILDIIRSISNFMNGTMFTWFPAIIAFVFVILRRILCTKPHTPVLIKKDDEWYQPVSLKDKNN
ncbi:unnamed protein product [Rotaria magnacalcarata]|uniref:Lipase maturation factor n=1 Tax=Rotaria magnacalcarata TaxID=392030 RepID=A0A820CR71_9BILA|nr:unnamed protein product [Rotaria magnacalcarata]CAF2018945.1 unnamed protein product [Rotaria magnacalcarata]CAF2053109.1 unnamed protein product [Rotaria magnacalcarata]CAF3940515.1 unnamed protein product [Rotaria magnacalcarata]CAF4139086.1 unnamed protein product [Rotaria magnacalcarata]